MTYHRSCNKSNTTGATSGAGTLLTIPVYFRLRISCCSIFSFLWNVLCIIVFPLVLFLLSIVLSALRFMDSDYPFDIFKPFKYSNFSAFFYNLSELTCTLQHSQFLVIVSYLKYDTKLLCFSFIIQQNCVSKMTIL